MPILHYPPAAPPLALHPLTTAAKMATVADLVRAVAEHNEHAPEPIWDFVPAGFPNATLVGRDGSSLATVQAYADVLGVASTTCQSLADNGVLYTVHHLRADWQEVPVTVSVHVPARYGVRSVWTVAS